MKRLIFTVITVLLSVVNSFAENVSDTTIVYNGMDVKLSGSGTNINVSIAKSNTTICTTQYSDSVTVTTTSRIIEDIPLLNLINKASKRKQRRKDDFTPHIACFSVGMNKPMNIQNDKPDNNIARSTNITFIPFDHGFTFNNNFGLGIGLGFEWENYRLTDDEMFVYQGKSLEVVNVVDFTNNSNAHVDESKLRTFGFIMPVMLEVQGTDSKSMYFSAGIALNFVPRSRYYTKVSMDDEVMKFRAKGLHHNPFGCDIMAQLGYRDFGIFVRYSLTETFKSNHGPKMNALTCGLTFSFAD